MSAARPARPALAALALLLAAAAALPAQPRRDRPRRADPAGDRVAARTEEHTVAVDGRARRYLLHVPARLRPGVAAPLVLVFHGGGGSADQVAREHGVRELAEREGFVAAFPDGVDRRWRDGYLLRERDGVDEAAFVRALLADVGRRVAVDARRVYATGHSNGGFLVQALACELPGTFAAIAPVAAQVAEGLARACAGGAPVSVLAVNGTADALIPFAGGRWRGGAPLLSAEASGAFRAGLAGCAATPRTVALPDPDPDDGTSVRRLAWDGCADGRAVELLAVDGGSHRWPGSAGRRAPRQVARSGVPSTSLDATAAIWGFFAAHPAP